ncbi:fimbria/pilus outer membrane usher protein [Escherichia coli]
MPFASVAQLVRPGFSRWQVAAGRYRYGNRTFSDTVFQGTLQYGLTNDITLNTGMSTPTRLDPSGPGRCGIQHTTGGCCHGYYAGQNDFPCILTRHIAATACMPVTVHEYRKPVQM